MAVQSVIDATKQLAANTQLLVQYASKVSVINVIGVIVLLVVKKCA